MKLQKTIVSKEDVDKWKITGLLYNLNEIESFRLALILENTVEFMRNNNESMSDFAKRAFLPLIARIYRLNPAMIKIDFNALVQIINKFYKKELKKLYDEFGSSGLTLDVETEACLKISELYIKSTLGKY